MTTVLHISDLHFGAPAVPEQYEALEAMIADGGYDVVAISGDVSQRARAGEFQRARAFIRHVERVSRTIVVPGNHDVAWWYSPLGMGDDTHLLAKYKAYVGADPEPVLRVPGVTMVGLNTSHGVTAQTLTWNPRQWSIIGRLSRAQLARAKAAFEASPAGDARVIVMHHNPVKGELSKRHGLKDTKKVLGAFAEMNVDLVLCGHDHQEAIHYVEHTRKGTVISTAGTVSNRMRGGRPSSANSILITPKQLEVASLVWSNDSQTFVAGPVKCFDR
jgi:3',5'-cyclic AMP phosphodiesterase CpdA